MKKKITIILTIAFLSVVLWADPGDVVITLTIPAAKVAQFRAGFLREHPVPQIRTVDANGLPVMENQYTDKQWFKKVVVDYANREAKHGNDKIAKEAAANDSNIME